MTQSTQDITALRQRMSDDMRMRKFAAKTQSHTNMLLDLSAKMRREGLILGTRSGHR